MTGQSEIMGKILVCLYILYRKHTMANWSISVWYILEAKPTEPSVGADQTEAGGEGHYVALKTKRHSRNH